MVQQHPSLHKRWSYSCQSRSEDLGSAKGIPSHAQSVRDNRPVTERDSGLVPVVFIAGMSRSGSTLLDRLLGQLPGWWTLGEVVHLWTRGVFQNELCGCGTPFLDCPVWSAIGEEAFGGWKRVDVDHVLRLKQSVERDRYTPLLLKPGRSTGFHQRLGSYNELTARIYSAARTVTGASVIVDASKHTAAALALRHNPAIDLRVVHLMRDSRGVAFSLDRKVPYPARGTMMPRQSSLEAAIRYVAYNSLLTSAFRTDRHFVRYEDLVCTPDHVLARLCQWATRDNCRHATHIEHPVVLQASHGLAGNPMRVRSGPTELRIDQEWQSAMSPTARFLVTAITAPSLIHANYSLRSRPATDARR